MSIFKDTFRKYVRNQISLREELIDIGNTDDNGVRSKRRAQKDVKLQDGTNVTIDPGAFFTYSLRSSSVINSLLLTLNDSFFFDTAVPKLSIFSEKLVLTTSVIIISGGGLLPNFFAK